MGNTETSTHSHVVDYKGKNSAVLAEEGRDSLLVDGLNIKLKNSFKVCFVVFQY